MDPDSGKEQPVETFVAILGASELTYVEASATQQGEDWIRSNERALRYCGGGTQVIVPDNLRSAVSRSDPYEPGINATFDAFAQHYGVVIMPARVRQARDKALVENAVRLTYQRIYAPLRDRTFHSLDELNAAIGPLLEQHNGRRFQRLPYSRRELFEQIALDGAVTAIAFGGYAGTRRGARCRSKSTRCARRTAASPWCADRGCAVARARCSGAGLRAARRDS